MELSRWGFISSAAAATAPLVAAPMSQLANLPWGEAGIAIMLAAAGGMFAWVLATTTERSDAVATPWWVHVVFAVGAGFFTFTYLADSDMKLWHQVGILFGSGIAGRGILVGIQIAVSSWIKFLKEGK